MFRPDIQGLRALAVALVFAFHVWPAAVPGGFVGVDVFFVVSGYLITGLLLRELGRTDTVSLGAFYGRRIRRLLPAASLVLGAVIATTPWLLSRRRWEATATDVIASAVYAQNWWLASRAVDYQAQDTAASPVQHFWSLAIEEQFYVVWPGLLLLLHRLRLGREGATAALGLVIGGSFAASVVLSGETPAAYFVSHTRVWELGIGALLASVPGLERPRPWLAWPGVAAILASGWLVTGATPFPGVAALLPTLGCASVIAAGPEGLVARGLSAAPLRFLGDRSYAVYLWHWPLVVLWTAHGRTTGPGCGAAVALGTAVLALPSYRFVEERFRHPHPAPDRGVAAIAGVSLLPVALAVGVLASLRTGAPAAAPDDPNYPGAAVLFSAAVAPPGVPPSAEVRGSKVGYTQVDRAGGTALIPNRYGTRGGKRVALIGDSHAGHWLPALAPIARSRGWDLEAHLKGACTPLLVPISDAGKPYEACVTWGRNVRARLDEFDPEIVIFSHSRWARPAGATADRDAAMVEALRAMWADYGALGATLVVLPDVPRWSEDPMECLERDPGCAIPLTDPALAADLIREAARGEAVRVLDLLDLVCPDGRCPPVIGNVEVWRDKSHLTPLYVTTMQAEIDRRLQAVLDARP